MEIPMMSESGIDLIQKLGDFDAKRFKELLLTFDEPVEYIDRFVESSPQQRIILKNNKCKFCDCFECIADSEEGRYICAKCGRDNGEILDSTQEWRNQSCDDVRRGGDPARVGLPVNEHFMKSSLSTVISGWGYQNYRRFQKYNTMDYDERSLLKNFQFIDTSTEDLCTEVVKEHAKNVYKTISENENKRGKKKQSNMAACVYFASEGRGDSVDKEKLSESFLVSKKKFTKGCNFYREKLFEKEPEFYAKMRPVSAEDEIKRLCNLLGMKEIYRNITCYAAYMAQELGVVIKNTPISIPVGSIFLIANVYELEIDKKEIVDKCDISDVTINKSFALLMSYRNYLIPTEKLYQRFIELQRD